MMCDALLNRKFCLKKSLNYLNFSQNAGIISSFQHIFNISNYPTQWPSANILMHHFVGLSQEGLSVIGKNLEKKALISKFFGNGQNTYQVVETFDVKTE